MEKRLVLAFALTIIVFVGFQQFQQRNPDKFAQTPATDQVGIIKEPETGSQKPAMIEEATKATTSAVGDTVAAKQTIVVQGDLYRAVIDNQGAVLSGFELYKYKSVQHRNFEMIASNHGSGQIYPTSLIFQDQRITGLANSEPYEVLVNGQAFGGGLIAPPATVVLRLKRGPLTVEKKFSFEKENCVFNLASNFSYNDKPLEGKFFLGQDIGPEQEHLLGTIKLEVAYYADGKVRRKGPPDDEKEIEKIEGGVHWVGLDMQFFTMIAIPSVPIQYFEIQKKSVKAVGVDGKQVDRDLLKVTLPINGSLQYQMYLGAKKQADLKAVKNADITGVVNYGMFSIIVYPLLASLRWIHQYVHNYGFSIVLLTFLLSLLLFPFRLKQILSMKKMSVVQPKVKAIQEKYKRYKTTDPKRAEMNQEIMALYKEHNVNPLGGCLPLLLQMPLLFAFYSLLAYSIELRQAPFVLWIMDLSVKDPYYVLPIIMGITAFISQKMTPMTPGADPTQAKVMMVMPLIFTVMFINMSSGLNLYFLCSNIFQVGFQKIAERWIGDGKSNVSGKS
jgi:YidC/Oxa1 family membrane protein insertase